MSTVTVLEFANELNRPVTELLSQFREAGVSVKEESSSISAQDKIALLTYLRQKTARASGQAAEATDSGAEAGARRISLKRKETSELKVSGVRGAPTKTVSIEVRKRRTLVPTELPEPVAAPQPTEAEIAAREAEAAERALEAERVAARKAAEAEAKRAQEDAERKLAEAEEQAVRDAEEKAKSDKVEHERLLKDDLLYRQRWEASQSRRRAEENLRRSAEMRAATPPPVAAPVARTLQALRHLPRRLHPGRQPPRRVAATVATATAKVARNCTLPRASPASATRKAARAVAVACKSTTSMPSSAPRRQWCVTLKCPRSSPSASWPTAWRSRPPSSSR